MKASDLSFHHILTPPSPSPHILLPPSHPPLTSSLHPHTLPSHPHYTLTPCPHFKFSSSFSVNRYSFMSSLPSKQPHICWNKDWSSLLPVPPLQDVRHTVQAKHITDMSCSCSYSTCHKKLYEIRRNPRNPQSFCAAIHRIAVLLPRIVSPISAE